MSKNEQKKATLTSVRKPKLRTTHKETFHETNFPSPQKKVMKERSKNDMRKKGDHESSSVQRGKMNEEEEEKEGRGGTDLWESETGVIYHLLTQCVTAGKAATSQLVERFHQTLKSMLRKMAIEKGHNQTHAIMSTTISPLKLLLRCVGRQHGF